MLSAASGSPGPTSVYSVHVGGHRPLHGTRDRAGIRPRCHISGTTGRAAPARNGGTPRNGATADAAWEARSVTTYVFDSGRVRPAPLATPVVADSWLVTRGRVRALDAHRARLSASLVAMASGTLEGSPLGPVQALDALRGVEECWPALVRLLPRRGAWFPRVEVDATGRIGLRLRPSPPRGRTVQLWVAGPDERRFPRVKGPDLPMLLALCEAAMKRGADEAVLTRDGFVVEGATTCLLWWDHDTLCAPDPDLATLPGVTSGLVLAEAESRGIPVDYRRARPEDLDGAAVWVLNALHGLRPVTGWVDSPLRAGPARAAGSWREWLDSLTRPMPPR